MAIQWNASLTTGVDEIDNQHKELFRQVNELLDACHRGKGPEAIGEMLTFLDKYARHHFSTEENLMTRYGFPGLDAHREQHNEFMKNLAEVKHRFQTEGPGVHIVVITNRVLTGWLLTHIRKSDKVLGSFIKAYLEAK